jgi:SnoaL-like domain
MGEALETAALNWLEAINSRRLGDAEAMLAEAATHHDDGMWLLQPARGRTVIRRAWRDWLRSVPDYALSPITIAVDTAGGDAFILWRASGTAKLPLVPQLPLTGKPFVHHGVTRLRFNAEGLITDQWTWRGPTNDEAKWLLLRSHRSFDCAAVVRDMYGGGGSPAGSPGGSPSASFDGAMLLRGSPPLMATATFGACGDSPAARAAGKAAALSFRDALGCNGGDVAGLEAILADNYSCHVRGDVVCSAAICGASLLNRHTCCVTPAVSHLLCHTCCTADLQLATSSSWLYSTAQCCPSLCHCAYAGRHWCVAEHEFP